MRVTTPPSFAPYAPKDRTGPLLFDLLPDLASGVAWMPLAHAPTAVEPCAAIEGWLGRGGVFMKRDDLVSPLYGGNKIRRWEFVLADALASGAKRIVTVGGLASTQAMATALFARALGLEVTIVLFDQPVTRFGRESVRALAGAGAELVYGGGYLTTAWRALVAGRGGYFVMPGAASPRANLGYVDAMLELAGQVERGEAPRPDVIVVPSGSAGTLAGLALGAARLGWSTEVVGVRITTPIATNRVTAGALVRATDRFLAKRDRRWKRVSSRARFSFYGAALGDGYGHPTPEAIDGAERIRDLTGAPGEVTYSGKALAALRAIGRARPRDTLLLWNTLSTPRPTVFGAPPPSLDWMFEGEPVA